jgi:hypothetical protein
VILRTSSILRAREVASDQAEAAAIDELDGSEVQQDVWALRQKPVETHLK